MEERIRASEVVVADIDRASYSSRVYIPFCITSCVVVARVVEYANLV